MAHPSEQGKQLNDLLSIGMTQFSINQGIKRFGNEGVEAVQAEMKHMHDRAVLKPVVASQRSLSEKKASLQYLLYLKQKRNCKIKGRVCADGRKQRLTSHASAPTVSVEALMLSYTIDAKEGRDIATSLEHSCKPIWRK